MNTSEILRSLREQRERVGGAIAALEGRWSARGRNKAAGGGNPRRGIRRGTRRMSAEARRRISEAQKKSWAKRKRKKQA